MKELPKAYESQTYEDKIYKRWEESGFFNPDVCVKNGVAKKNAKTFTIILPPPNITSKLHLGHASTLAIEDVMVRYHRMKGDRTLWLPGTDHAAIATQNVVEKKIYEEEGLTRHDLGREKLLERVWAFLRATQSVILKQTRKMGASLDWSREAFTLDEKRVNAVKKMFVDMYNEGVIYRGERIVNWCPRCQSTLADDEVEYKKQKAVLYTFRYSKDFPFAIATTRPETKLGDTAVAVNPKDGRYKKYIGREFKVDFCGVDLKIKVIGDWHVDMEFGTGALGVTPAHSMADWQIAEANGLEIVKVISEDGKIRKGFSGYSGKSVEQARDLVVEHLKQNGLLEKEEEIENNLSVCYRCDTAIEPLPSKQWFVSVDKKLKRLGGKSLKEKAIEAAEKGDIKFIPDRFSKRYLDWMNNLHDWCISRQIWFGHRIPVWYKNNEVHVGDAPQEDGWKQDEDSLDTWFSSGMWTFSTLGWPASSASSADTAGKLKKTGDLAEFHPTQVLETGYEILTLWVSRMIMMSFFAIGEIPFENVYLHGMVLDKNGKKMSKSKGNGIDPLDMIEKFGTDAVRLSLLIGNTPGNDVRLFEEKIEGYRNFTNKLWNMSRFILLNVAEPKEEIKKPRAKTLVDKWILCKLDNATKEITDGIEKFNFSYAGEQLRDFTWNELADWYLEIAKIEGDKAEILNYILNTVLKLWHPFLPFVTEQIWGEIYGEDSLLMVKKWPGALDCDKKGVEDFDLIQNIIGGIRSLRADNKIEPAKKLDAVICGGDKLKVLRENSEIIVKLARLGKLEINEKANKTKTSIGFVEGKIEVFIELAGVVDFAKEKERLEKEIKNVEPYILQLEKKLENKSFVDGAPAEIVNSERTKLEEAKSKLLKLKEQYNKIT